MDSILQFANFKDIGTFVHRLLWHIVHFLIGFWYGAVGIVRVVESYLVSQGWLKKYEYLNIRVLKRSKDVIMEKLGNASLFGVPYKSDSQFEEKHMTLEFASVTDGKEAVAKAAKVLLQKLKSEKVDSNQDVGFTEEDMFDTLKSIGYGVPDPDLLLVYARCNLGFPAWRLGYTAIVHMNKLKRKQYGSLIKAIYKFTIVRQNYGK